MKIFVNFVRNCSKVEYFYVVKLASFQVHAIFQKNIECFILLEMLDNFVCKRSNMLDEMLDVCAYRKI